MKIERDGKTIELTATEIEAAYREQELTYRVEDMKNTAADLGYSAFLNEKDYNFMAHLYLDDANCDISENAQREHIVETYVKDHFQQEMEIMQCIIAIEEAEEQGLLSFAIEEAMKKNLYDELGEDVIRTFKNNPMHLALLEKMLVSICGCRMADLTKIMAEKRDYYNSL